MVEDIVNESTIILVQEIFARRGLLGSQWPGETFRIADEGEAEDGLALLGCSNGLALGWLLIYNVETFPRKTVVSVDVFADGVDRLCLCYNLGPLENAL